MKNASLNKPFDEDLCEHKLKLLEERNITMQEENPENLRKTLGMALEHIKNQGLYSSQNDVSAPIRNTSDQHKISPQKSKSINIKSPI